MAIRSLSQLENPSIFQTDGDSPHTKPAEVVRRFLEEFAGGRQFESLDEMTTEDVIFTSPQTAGIGRRSVRRYFEESASAFANLEVSVHYLLESGTRVAARICIRGQQTKTYAGIKSENRRISLPCVYLFELRDGKICGFEVFYDLQLLTSQMGNGQVQPLR